MELFAKFILKTKNVAICNKPSNAIKNIIMEKSVKSVKNKLIIYKNEIDKTVFYTLMINIAEIIEKNQVDIDSLKIITKSIKNYLTKNKILDIYTIIKKYNKFIDNICNYQENPIITASKVLKNSTILKNYSIFIDGS